MGEEQEQMTSGWPTTPEQLYSRLVRQPGAILPLFFGVLIVGYSTRLLESGSGSLVDLTVGFGMTVFPGLFLVACAGWLVVGNFDGHEIRRILTWSLTGAVPTAVLASVFVVYQQAHGVELIQPTVVTLWVAGTGAVGGLVTGVYDVRQNRHRRRLRATSTHLETVIETAPVAIIRLDRNAVVRGWNRAAEEIFGWQREEIVGKPYPLVTDEYRAEYEQHRQRVNRGEMISGIETRRKRKDGTLVDVGFWAMPVEQEGTVTGHTIAMMDISDRIEHERELQRLELAIEQADDGVLITDRRGVIEYANEAFVEMSGYDREELVGKTPQVVKSGKNSDELYTDLWETITEGEVWQSELTNRRKNGELFDVDLTVTPVEEDGEIRHFVAIERDITDRKRDDQRLSVLNRVLRHNVRNAVTVILGNVSRAEDRNGELDDTALDAIRRQARDLESVAEKARNVGHALTKEYADTVTVADLVERRRADIEDEYPAATVDVDLPETLTVRGDDSLALAFEEAIRNAIEHTDGNRPQVRVSGDEGTDGMVHVRIRDDGPGIPEHERRVLTREEESPLDHGSGIGLWLMKWIVENCGGEIHIAEKADSGTTVVVSLPRATTAGNPLETTN